MRSRRCRRMNGNGGWRCRARWPGRASVLPIFLQNTDRLPPGKAAVQLVPVVDPVFAQLPAQVDIAALVAGQEIDQADRAVLQLAANLVDLFNQIVQALEFSFEFVLQEIKLPAAGGGTD